MLICNKKYIKEGLSQYQTVKNSWMHFLFMQLSNNIDKAEIQFGHVTFPLFCNILNMQMLGSIQVDEVYTVPSLLHP